MDQSEVGTTSGQEEKGGNLWNVLPSFDPAQDDAREYADKARFLHGICPQRDKGMLAPRLAMLCKGTAWMQVKSINPALLTDPVKGVEALLAALAPWQETAEMQTYEKFEKALYQVTQKNDETFMSYANRLQVAFHELGEQATVKSFQAFVLLRQSALPVEDRKRVIAMTDGTLDKEKVDRAIRTLSTRVLVGNDVLKKKVYPVNFVDDETEDTVMFTADKDEVDEEAGLALLAEEGDEQALLIQDFEEQIIEVVQDNPDLAMAFTSYQEARQKIKDRLKSRGFWPQGKGSGKVKGKSKSRGKGRAGQSLAERIASSTCRRCGKKGHWKNECPLNSHDGATANVAFSTGSDKDYTEVTEIFSELPAEVMKASLIQGGAQQFRETSAGSSNLGQAWLLTCSRHLLTFLVQVQVMMFSIPWMMMHVLNLGHGYQSEMIFHVREGTKPSKYWQGFKQTFAAALKAYHDGGRQATSSPGSYELGSAGTGILDTGASRTVIGRKKVAPLLQTLPEWVQARVYWQESQTVFRFGNDDTLQAEGALFVPLGRKWLKIEVVSGNTPFLISNSFLRSLRATLHMANDQLHVPEWNRMFGLKRNGKGLFVLALHEIVQAAHEHAQNVVQRVPQTEEVVTHVHTPNNPDPESNEHLMAAKVAQQNAIIANVLEESQGQLRGDDDVPSQHGVFQEAPRGGDVLLHGCTADDTRGLTSAEFNHAAGSIDSTTRDLKPSTMGEGDSQRGQVQGQEFSGNLGGRQGIRGVDPQILRPQECQLVELSSLCQDPLAVRSGGQDESNGDGIPVASRELGAGGIECSARGGSDVSLRQEQGPVVRFAKEEQSGREDRHVRGLDGRGTSGALDAHCPAQGGDRPPDARSGGEEVNDRSSEVLDEKSLFGGRASATEEVYVRIEEAISSIESALLQMETSQKGMDVQGGKSFFRVDVLEVYCEPSSQVTQQARALGLKAERFTREDGDLATPAGQKCLMEMVHKLRPREIWVAPECRYWGNFSRLNSSRSPNLADKIAAGRAKQQTHLKLCNKLFLHQMSVGGHFHLEQPQGSNLIEQKAVRDIKYGTLCTTFDMCEVGKLMSPTAKRLMRGNNYLRKRTTVFTTSRTFHDTFDSRLCAGKHSHQRIEGKVFYFGRWVSLSEYAAKYSAGFGKNVARYLGRPDVERDMPLVWSELCTEETPSEFVGAIMSRRRALDDTTSEVTRHEKKRRYVGKQPPRSVDQEQAWDNILSRLDPMVPRVGKRVFEEEDPNLSDMQALLPASFKLRRVEACRGTDRLRIPDDSVSREEIPLRLTVVRRREDGGIETSPEPENWTRLPKRQQIRKGVAARLSLTLFGSRREAVQVDTVADQRVQGDREDSVEEAAEPIQGGPPRCIARHGPAFLRASSEVQSQLRRMHHNLGHPSPDRFAKYLKERHADVSMVRAALDFQCDSCTEAR